MAPETPFQGPPAAADVYARSDASATLGSLDAALGYTTHVEADLDRLWARWYQAIAQVPLSNLADDDVARVLDGGVHLPVVLPLALQRIRAAFASEPPPDRLLEAAARAARRIKDRLPNLTSETRDLLESMQRKAPAAPPQPSATSAFGERPSWRDALQAALVELGRLVPQEGIRGWREPPSPMSRWPSAQELTRGDEPAEGPAVKSPYQP